MRSDMDSLNPGKCMAQASHASNAFVKHASEIEKDISEWQNSTKQGFGTVIVLDGGGISKIEKKITPLVKMGMVAGMVFDPTYPILDGSVIHYIPINTCAYVYCDEYNKDIVEIFLSDLSLYK